MPNRLLGNEGYKNLNKLKMNLAHLTACIKSTHDILSSTTINHFLSIIIVVMEKTHLYL